MSSTFGRLYNCVWYKKHLKKGTKISVYRAIVLATLRYDLESWVTYCHHLQLHKRFHQRCFHTILNIHWRDFVTNFEVFENTKITSIESMLRWTGHVSRKVHRCLLRIHCTANSPLTIAAESTKKDSLKKSFCAGHIDYRRWSTRAENHDALHFTINHVAFFENTRKAAPKNKGYRRKNCNTMPSSPRPSAVAAVTVPVCSASALSVSNVLAVSMDRSVLELRFTNPSHDLYIYIYIYVCVCVCVCANKHSPYRLELENTPTAP